MKYFEFYKEQLTHNDCDFYKSEIFKEYCALNCFLNDFERSSERIEELILEDIDMLSKDEIQGIEKSAQILKENIENLKKENHPMFTQYQVDGVVFIIGDKTIDSHGILVGEKSYLIVDLQSYYAGFEKYNPISFLVHEITHSIHYKLNPIMYFRNYEEKSEFVLERLFVEGVATYASMTFTNESDEDVFWLGYLDKYDITRWKDYSKDMRKKLDFV